MSSKAILNPRSRRNWTIRTRSRLSHPLPRVHDLEHDLLRRNPAASMALMVEAKQCAGS
jgi:hypothetical protein